MYRPDIARYQQLKEPISGRFDCAAYAAAMAAAADSRGKWKLTGRQVRLATDEAIPDKISPGLNLRQTDDAVVILTRGEVNLDSQWGRNAAPWSRVEAKLKAGHWGHLAVERGPLVDAGFSGGDKFRLAHGVLIGYDPDELTPIMGDPLVPHWQNVTWAALKRAAGGFATFGFAAIAFTRAIVDTPAPPVRYSVRFTPQSFFAYRVNEWTLKVLARDPRKFSAATSAPCEAPRWHNWPGEGNRKLAQVTAPKSSLFGLYVEPGASGIKLVVSK